MDSQKQDASHFSQKQRRKAEFIGPVNFLRAKVGYGGRVRLRDYSFLEARLRARGDDLMQALEAACRRYFAHHPDGR